MHALEASEQRCSDAAMCLVPSMPPIIGSLRLQSAGGLLGDGLIPRPGLIPVNQNSRTMIHDPSSVP